MKGLRLYKKEKLCSEEAIDRLFSRGEGVSTALRYPLRAVWRRNDSRRSDAPLAFLISVPKKRLRHAVDRVTMRRRIREAYRLSRKQCRVADGIRLDVAFIYVADTIRDYASISEAMQNLLSKIGESLAPESNNQTQPSATV